MRKVEDIKLIEEMSPDELSAYLEHAETMLACRQQNEHVVERSAIRSFSLSRAFQLSDDYGVIGGRLVLDNDVLCVLPHTEDGNDPVKVNRIIGPYMLRSETATLGGYFVPFGCDPKYKEEAFAFLENNVFKKEEVK